MKVNYVMNKILWSELTFVEARADCDQRGCLRKLFFAGNYSSKNRLGMAYLKAPVNRLLVEWDGRNMVVV